MKKKTKIILGILSGALSLCFIACIIVYHLLGGLLLSQQAADRWAGNSGQRFAQISAFFPVDENIKAEDISDFHSKIDAKLLEVSLESSDDSVLYSDAYCAFGKVNVGSEQSSSTAVSAIGVGGNYFLFHPFVLINGSYLSPDDFMKDRVLLDEDLAWMLFGGTDLAGLNVTINGEDFLVAGVISREDDFADKKAYTDGPGLYMSFEAFSKIFDSSVSCYEIVLADPISGFAKGIVSEAFPSAVIVENSSRYTLGGILEVIGSFGERSMNTEAVIYPYWENAARSIEDYMSLVLILSMVFAVMPAFCACWAAIVYFIKFRNYVKSKVPQVREQVVERRREKRYQKLIKDKLEKSRQNSGESIADSSNSECKDEQESDSVRL